MVRIGLTEFNTDRTCTDQKAKTHLSRVVRRGNRSCLVTKIPRNHSAYNPISARSAGPTAMPDVTNVESVVTRKDFSMLANASRNART